MKFKHIIALTLALICIMSLGVMIFAEDISLDVSEDVDTTIPETTVSDIGSPEASEGLAMDKIDKAIERLTSSTFWVAVISFVGSLIGLMLFVKRNFQTLKHAVSKLATHEKTSADSAANTQSIKDALASGNAETLAELKALREEYKMMMTVFTVFIENTKMNTNAKSEILGLITKLKPLADNVPQAVAEALERIKKANSLEEKPDTPALDAAISILEEKPRMSLE